MSNESVVNNRAAHWIGVWLLVGLAWLALGVVYIPVNKIYQQGVAILFYVPMIILLWQDRFFFKELFLKNKLFFAIFFIMLGYAEINSFFRGDFKTIKYPVYVGLFVLSGGWIAAASKLVIIRNKVLYFILFGVVLASFISIAIFLLDSEKTFLSRMIGILQINHVILGSYYVSFYLLCCVVLFLDRKEFQWLLFIVTIGLFVLFAQSRGAYLALVIALAGYFLLFIDKNKKSWFGLVLITCAMFFLADLYWEAIIRSGFSYRPEIIKSSIELALQKFWLGHGIGYKYLIYTDNYHEGFLHTHNLLAHLFIELGVVGVLLFLLLWCYAFYFCYKNRHLTLSRLTCAWLIYSFVAFQTDAASFIAQPRLEWIVCWVPLCLVVAVMGQLIYLDKKNLIVR